MLVSARASFSFGSNSLCLPFRNLCATLVREAKCGLFHVLRREAPYPPVENRPNS